MIIRKDLLPLNYYEYGQCFTGSESGMRYRLAREPLVHARWGDAELRKIPPQLKATVWHEPYSYEKTPKEERIEELFSYDEEGFAQAVDWMNRMHKEHFSLPE